MCIQIVDLAILYIVLIVYRFLEIDNTRYGIQTNYKKIILTF